MQAAANFKNPVDLQVTVPLTLYGFQYMGSHRLGHDWLYEGSQVYRDSKNSQGGCSTTLGNNGIVVGSIALNPQTNQILKFALDHFSYNSSPTPEQIDDMRGYIGRVVANYPKTHTYLFIIGDDQVTPYGSLLADVRIAIEKHFGNTDCIRQQELDVCKNKNGNTLQARILPDGTMNYCVYNR